MKTRNKIAALTILTALNFSNIGQTASIDDELAMIAAEQEEPFGNEIKSTQLQNNSPAEKKSRKDLKEEEKRLRDERKAEEKQTKEDMKNAEKEFKEAQKKSRDVDKAQLKISERDSLKKDFPIVDPVAPKNEQIEIKKNPIPKIEPDNDVVTFNPEPVQTPAPTPKPEPVQTPAPTPTPEPIQTPAPTPTPEQPVPPVVNLSNPLVTYATFEDLAEAVQFVPLYIPKKAGFSIESMFAIDGRVAEIRYGRRWEPDVSLSIRTYKRTPSEDLKDISGVNGVKWRVDMSSGTSVYIAKIDERQHVAAWAAGDYTFSAQVENLSFAAFHAIVVEELVDLSNHYYIN
ncbi:MAG: hypothetical protein IK062_03715 [Selenomonadaceae bacterium]|nr:hypothetical protein [Selenomonadaceae bacterium]